MMDTADPERSPSLPPARSLDGARTVDASPSLPELQAAAERGTPDDAYRFALALFDARRIEESQQWHLRAAEQGHADAQVRYARMRLYGFVGDEAPEAAIDWLLRAERAGHAEASELLAMIALGDVALPRDGRIEERLYAAMAASHPAALLAGAVHFGRKAHPHDQAICVDLLERATAAGSEQAAALLAERLLGGEGCEARPEVAEHLWRRLQARGLPRMPHFTVPAPIAAAGAPGRLDLEETLRTPPAHRLHEHPAVSIVDGLLSADECRLLVAAAAPYQRDSQTADLDTGIIAPNAERTSSETTFEPALENCAIRLVQLRMAAAAGCALVQAERLTVLRYRPGQEYRLHRDYLPPRTLDGDRPHAGNRLRTVCAYLNPVESGGATEFPTLGLRIDPRPGRALVFDNTDSDGTCIAHSAHAGTPVVAGEKWLATLWLRRLRYRSC